MLRRSISRLLVLLVVGYCVIIESRAQIPEQVVPLTAEVSTSPPVITIKWPMDPTAPFYKVRRRSPGGSDWQEVAELPGTAHQYVDTDVAVGGSWEYAVTRSKPLPTMDTLCVPGGTEVTFTIYDTFGNGLCCWNSNGYWQIHACGSLIAEGGRYEFQDQYQFEMCGAQSCDELVIVIYPDHGFNEISWQVNAGDGTLLGQGAPEMAPMFGYILAGIDRPAIEVRGTIMLLIDEQHSEALTAELDRLERDLIGEGWLVLRENVAPGISVTQVKSSIISASSAHPDLSALLLIGNIPVPYSGVIAPDEHDDHVGAWPADLYYAELDANWTDDQILWQPWNVPDRNHNVPGDGHFDQSTLPSDVDLMIGRIDLSDLQSYPITETELLRAYLERDHLFRTGNLFFERLAVIDENFDNYDHESAVYRSCIPMFGEANVYDSPFLKTLAAQAPLWSMAGGPGSFNSAQGIGTSADIAGIQLNGAFAHVLGSYFGDWDTPDNFLRTILANGSMLGVVWGLQEVGFHEMALGGLIGESVLTSQNSSYDRYERQGRLVNLSLHGDPTLQLFPAPKVEQITASVYGEGVLLQWTAVQGPIAGYNIYRRTDPTAHFERMNDSPITDLAFVDPDPIPGQNEYMVRALKRETSASGTYFVLGTGAITGIELFVSIGENENENDLLIVPNPNNGSFTVQAKNKVKLKDAVLFDLSGKRIAIEMTEEQDRLQIETSAVPGIYVLELIDENGLRTKQTFGIAE